MLRITQTNVSGFSAPNDLNVVPTDPLVSNTYLPSAYEALDAFVVDIVFEGMYPLDTTTVDPVTGATSTETTYQYAYATNVTSSYNWSSKGIEYSKPNAYTVRLTGPAEDVFVDQFYKFTMLDKSTKILPANTTEPFLALNHYNMPNPTYTMLTYPFSVTIPTVYGSSTTLVEEVNMSHWFYWRYQVAIANIAACNARGLR